MKRLLVHIIVMAISFAQIGCIGIGIVHGKYETTIPAPSNMSQVLQERGIPDRKFQEVGREY